MCLPNCDEVVQWRNAARLNDCDTLRSFLERDSSGSDFQISPCAYARACHMHANFLSQTQMKMTRATSFVHSWVVT